MTNENVIIAWTKGQAAKSLNMSTDGNDLFSYRLKIGTGGGSVIYNHTAGGGSFYSQTTSCHVGLAKSVALRAKVVNP